MNTPESETLRAEHKARIAAYAERMRIRGLLWFNGAMLLMIFGLLGLQIKPVAGLGFIVHVAGFLLLAAFISSDEREFAFPRNNNR